jgi:hypothetical protein
VDIDPVGGPAVTVPAGAATGTNGLDADEITITIREIGIADVVLQPTGAPSSLGGNLYRYYIAGRFTVGEVSVVVAPNEITDSLGIQNAAVDRKFVAEGATGSITGPGNGGAIGILSQNSRGFLDVTFGPRLRRRDHPGSRSRFTLSDSAIVLDGDQAPVLIGQTSGSATFRFWVKGSYASGPLSATFIAGSFGFTNGQSSTSTATVAIAAPQTVNLSWIDVVYRPTAGATLDDGSVTDGPAEFTLSGAGLGTAQLAAGYDPIRLTDSDTFRYFLSGDFAPGEVTVTFLANSFRAVEADGSFTANRASEQSFFVVKLTAAVLDPAGGTTIDTGLLNERGYIDVEFTLPAGAAAVDPDSVLDDAADLTITLANDAIFAIDESQLPLSRAGRSASGTARTRAT